MDVMGEHRFGETVSDLEEAFEVLDLAQEREKFALTIQPGRGNLADLVDAICDYVFEISDLTLALEEVPHYATASSMPEGLEVLARMGGEWNANLGLLICDPRSVQVPAGTLPGKASPFQYPRLS
jgi:hypothetical protein